MAKFAAMQVLAWKRASASCLAAFSAAALYAGPLVAAAPPEGGTQSCLLPSPDGTQRGPCQSPDVVDFLPGAAPVALTNFGMLFPAGGGSSEWEVSCDDNYELALPGRIRRAPDGRLFAASNRGLWSTADGCTFTVATGAAADKLIYDVTFDARNPSRVWALGDLPRKLWVSSDGGRSFVMQQAFADNLTFSRVVSAPSDPSRLYLFGRGTQGSSPAVASTDGGQTAVPFDLVARATPAPPAPFEFLDISSRDAQTLYFVAVHVDGDEVWKTTDGGGTVRRILKLEGMEALYGFAFGASDDVLYVAGASTDIIQAPGQPPARLYISRDGGATWLPPVPSSPKGPRYKCLSHQAGKLYACGAGDLMGDDAMLSSSSDEGKTWSPMVRLENLGSARSCVKSKCVATEIWLCETYGQCAPGMTPPRDAGPPPADAAPDVKMMSDAPQGDGGVLPPPPPARKSGGCGVSGAPASADGGLAGGLLLALFAMRCRRRRCSRGGGTAGSGSCRSSRSAS